MAATFQLPSNQIVDQNGNPRAGAKLEFYSAGTSTPRNVFSNDALTTILPQPVVADASGRFPPIFMTPVLYRVILKTSTDVVLNDWDNVDPGLPVGSGALPIANGGTGATTATAARANLGIVNDQPFVDVATAATMPIFAANSDHVNATGTTTVTAFDTAASGRDVLVRAVTGFQLTHSANLICPGARNIVLRADDTFRVVSQGAGISRVVMVSRARQGTFLLADTGFGAGATSITLTGLAGAARIIVKFNELTVVNSGESIVFQPGDSLGALYTTFSAARTRLIGGVLSGANDPNINIVASHNAAAANIRYHGQLDISGWTPSPGEDMVANLSCLYDSGATGNLTGIFRGEPLITLDRLRIGATAGNITGGNVLVYGVFV